MRILCEARGVPSPTITWFKDGAPLALSAEAVYTRGGRQLRLARARGVDAGTYTCKASNAVGVTDKTTRLAVYGERCAVGEGALWAQAVLASKVAEESGQKRGVLGLKSYGPSQLEQLPSLGQARMSRSGAEGPGRAQERSQASLGGEGEALFTAFQ